MIKNIMVVAATAAEVLLIKAKIADAGFIPQEQEWILGPIHVQFFITGVGMTATAVHLSAQLTKSRPDLVINVGIAGAYGTRRSIGDVVLVVQEQFGDLGIEESDGSFHDLFEVGLSNPDEFPFQSGTLKNEFNEPSFLPTASGLTVSKVHGYEPSIEDIVKKYGADIETMEGAAFFYTCLVHQLPFMAIRAISNKVEKRDRSAWRIELALENLSNVVKELLVALQ